MSDRPLLLASTIVMGKIHPSLLWLHNSDRTAAVVRLTGYGTLVYEHIVVVLPGLGLQRYL
jgi:hypothetical protein